MPDDSAIQPVVSGGGSVGFGTSTSGFMGMANALLDSSPTRRSVKRSSPVDSDLPIEPDAKRSRRSNPLAMAPWSMASAPESAASFASARLSDVMHGVSSSLETPPSRDVGGAATSVWDDGPGMMEPSEDLPAGGSRASGPQGGLHTFSFPTPVISPHVAGSLSTARSGTSSIRDAPLSSLLSVAEDRAVPAISSDFEALVEAAQLSSAHRHRPHHHHHPLPHHTEHVSPYDAARLKRAADQHLMASGSAASSRSSAGSFSGGLSVGAREARPFGFQLRPPSSSVQQQRHALFLDASHSGGSGNRPDFSPNAAGDSMSPLDPPDHAGWGWGFGNSPK